MSIAALSISSSSLPLDRLFRMPWMWLCDDWYLRKYCLSGEPPNSLARNPSLPPINLPLRPGSSSSTVFRSWSRSAPTPVSVLIARTGLSRKRLDWPAASRISFCPIAAIASTRLPNSGELTSCATRSSMKPSTRFSSSFFLVSSTGTSPAAFSGATTFTGSGAVSTRSCSATAVSVAIPNPPKLSRPPIRASRQLSKCVS